MKGFSARLRNTALVAGLVGATWACNALFGIGDGVVAPEEGGSLVDGAPDVLVRPDGDTARDAEVEAALPVPSHLTADTNAYRWDSTFSLRGAFTITVEDEKLTIVDGLGGNVAVADEWWRWIPACGCMVLSLDAFVTGVSDGGRDVVRIRQDAPLIIVARTVDLEGELDVLADGALPSRADGQPAVDGGFGGGGGGGGAANGGAGGNGGDAGQGAGGPRPSPDASVGVSTPLTLGGRGGGGGRGCVGGAGGGALQITALTGLRINGVLYANGAGGQACALGGGGGGGAGGMLWLESIGFVSLAGATIAANGGGGAAGASADGGATGPAGRRSVGVNSAAGGVHDAGTDSGGNGGTGGSGGATPGQPGRSSVTGGGGGGGVGLSVYRGQLQGVPSSSPLILQVDAAF